MQSSPLNPSDRTDTCVCLEEGEQALRSKCTHVLLSAKGTARCKYQATSRARVCGRAGVLYDTLTDSLYNGGCNAALQLDWAPERGGRTHRWGWKMIVGDSDLGLSRQPGLRPRRRGSEGLRA